GLTKVGEGALLLGGSNTYSGPTIVYIGTLIAPKANSLGAAGGGTTVSNIATLQIGGNITNVESSITLFGSLNDTSGTNAFSGTITLGSTNTAIDVTSSAQLTLSGAVVGSGGLLKTNFGILQFAGSNA